MTISELITAVGDDNIGYQNLAECFISAEAYPQKGIANVTFGTVCQNILEHDDGKRICLILWFDADRWPKKTAESEGASGANFRR